MQRRTLLGATATAVAAMAATRAAADRLPLGDLTGTRYPDPRVEVLDKRFKYKVGNAAIERIATGFRWAEGPVYVRDGGYLLWSDIPNNRMMRWLEEDGHVSVFRTPSNYSNGNTRDRQGRLLTCEHDARRVTRTEPDGTITVLMDSFNGKKLNAPNDIVVAADGAVWFTDPGYGIFGDYEGHKAELELPAQVYRLDPATGKATVVADSFDKPNGIAFSPDEKKLYIIDSGITHGGRSNMRVFDVNGDKLANDKIFAENFAPGFTDGVRTDTDGNVWCSMGWADPKEDGVRCYAPTGDLIGKIHLPETCANLCFGGKKRNRLFMAASTSVYAVYVDAAGALKP
ncbi:SMP-30/gluconolactonase/LRE family protein [Limobrevibacterium gyesilva]|uniref:SMP-30/gluconolactonase/LRE family protein n=1 Tax=Limobrevibacterium gyesilva TaxID=2991712 RepID=A0AA41YQX7_9PROT|nr:SMP-30/gluconolactonase/LRE family protein [Limobrevibacterium gyesilva]MCW3476653.1 SMP-30/gluconolactonase/LRE family protein [Limobrevibacterium gyesilva]